VITASVAIGSIGVLIVHITTVLVSMPVIAVVAHDATAHAEMTDDLPGQTILGSATASRSRSVEHGRSGRNAAGAPSGLRGGLDSAHVGRASEPQVPAHRQRDHLSRSRCAASMRS
jgi:hypothetical protein